MKNKIVIVISLIIVSGIIYWYFRFDIKHHFISKQVIFWKENVKLKPSDFQSEIDSNSVDKVWWSHGLYLKSTNFNDAKAFAIFEKNKSWIKDTLNFSEKMKFQQLNFDLYEVYARKFNNEINKIRYDNNKSFSDLKKIGDKIYLELEIMQDSIYNTNLDTPEVVKFWRPKIDNMLKQNQ
jgi:hypothetical protein